MKGLVRRRSNKLISTTVVLASMLAGAGAIAEEETTLRDHALKLLGKHVFFDTDLSNPKGNQACVSCHEPFAGGTSGFSDVNETTVAVPGATAPNIGNRKPPSNTYATFVPPFSPSSDPLCAGFSLVPFCGGNFWDGRSQGHPPVVDGTQPVAPFAAPHLGEEVFYNIENAAILAFNQYRGPTSDQALNPMPNAAEQNIARQDVCERVSESTYAQLYKLAWGEELNCSMETAYESEAYYDISFKRLMLSVGAYQHTEDINSFSSKRDVALRTELACDDEAGEFSDYYNPAICMKLDQLAASGSDKVPGKFPLLMLTDEENFGHDMFYNTINFFTGQPRDPSIPAASCAFCHSNRPAVFGPGDDGAELLQTYSDHSYHSIGTPFNPQIPNSPDTGVNRHLTGALGTLDGLFRTPTIRNVAKGAKSNFTKAYAHNGYFKSLESIVHFYNTRDVKPRCETLPELAGVELTEAVALANNCWPAPEFDNFGVLGAPFVGSLGLTEDEEAALVAYIRTLEDQHTAKPPKLLQANTSSQSPVALLFGTEQWADEVCELSPGYGVMQASARAPKDCVRVNDLIEVLGEGAWLK